MTEVKSEPIDQKVTPRENRTRRRSSYRANKVSRYITPFEGGIDDLKGHYYDCSSGKQADRYVNTTRQITEYVGREYKYGGDIRATIENMTLFNIPKPEDPSDQYQLITKRDGTVVTAREKVSYTDSEVFKHEINEYMRRKSILRSNLQKGYSLVLGQGTELMKSS